MSETLVKFIDYIPFIGMVAGNNHLGNTPIFTRLVEAAIIGVFAGFIAMKGTVAVLGEQITNLDRNQQEMKQQFRDFRRDFYAPRVIE